MRSAERDGNRRMHYFHARYVIARPALDPGIDMSTRNLAGNESPCTLEGERRADAQRRPPGGVRRSEQEPASRRVQRRETGGGDGRATEGGRRQVDVERCLAGRVRAVHEEVRVVDETDVTARLPGRGAEEACAARAGGTD